MNKGFITALISRKYSLYSRSDGKLIIKLLLQIPSINRQQTLYDIQACAFGNIAKKISELCIEGEYLFLEGSVWTSVDASNILHSNKIIDLLFIITDVQPIF